MELSRNVFKQALKERRLQIGLWSSLASNIGAEIIADSGFDWILLDTEHSPNEVPNLLSQLQALERGTATPVIRPAWNDPVLIKRVLDIGTQSVLLPYVQNPDEARRAVAAVRYPPARHSRRCRNPARQPLWPRQRLSQEGGRRDLPAGTGRDQVGARSARSDRRGRGRRRRVHRAGRSFRVAWTSRQCRSIPTRRRRSETPHDGSRRWARRRDPDRRRG